MKLEAITAKNNVEDLLLQHIKIHQKYLDQTSENRKKSTWQEIIHETEVLAYTHRNFYYGTDY